MKEIMLSEIRDNFTKYLRLAANEGIVIIEDGKPAGVLLGFENEDDLADYALENDPRFLQRMAAARQSLRDGQGVPLEEIEL